MGWVKDTFLGGAEKKASQQQVAAGKEAQAINTKYYEDARKSIMDLMGPQYGNIMQAYQQAAGVLGQGKASSADILKQAFSNSNQLIQSGNDQAMAALLGRPSQMQLPQQAQLAPSVMPTSGLRSRLQSGMTMSNQVAQTPEMMQEDRLFGGQMPMTPTMMQEDRLFNGQMPMAPSSAGGQFGIPIQSQKNVGGVAMPISEPMMPTQMPTSITPTQMPQAPTMNQVDTSGIGLAGSEQALQQGLQGQTNAYLTGLNQATGTMQDALGGQLGALRQGATGSANAINQGLQGQLGAYGGALNQSTNTLQQGLQGQLGFLNQGFGGAEQALNQYGAQALGAANQGYGQARQDIGNTLAGVGSAIGAGVGAMQAGEDRALSNIDKFTGQAVNTLNPYAQTGQAALGQEAALSGAMGGAAQQQAINQFMESPGQKFLREQGEKAVLRNAAATGGLRGGSTMAALQERGIGLAAQNQQQQLENMRSLASRGQEASTNQAGFQQQAGTTGAGISAQLAGQQGQLYGQQAGIQGQLGGQLAGLANQSGQFGANILNQVGQNVSGLRSGLGQLQSGAVGNVAGNVSQNQMGAGQLAGGAISGAGGNLAQILSGLGQNESSAIGSTGQNIAQGQFGTGQNIGNAISNTGQALSGLRTQAGRDVANQTNATTGQLSGNQLNLGQMLAGLDSNTASQLMSLIIGGATSGADQSNALAQILANLATGQGSNLAGLQTQIGNAQAAGTVGKAGAVNQTIGMLFGSGQNGSPSAAQNMASVGAQMFSDERLKDNITKIADGAVGLFAWTWKHIEEIPEKLRGVPSVGVIAQEVLEKFPSCVHGEGGYLKVDYVKLSEEISHA